MEYLANGALGVSRQAKQKATHCISRAAFTASLSAMVRALSAAQRALDHSLAKETAYKDAVTIYTESRRTFEMSADPNCPRPVSLRDLAARYGGLISVTTLSRRVNTAWR